MKKLFTLIEMLAVIVVLGILAAIIIPNIADLQPTAYTTKVVSNIQSIQTATDKYHLDHNNQYPTVVQPTLTEPQLIDFNLLYPEYLRDKPPLKEKYWVDYFGKIWGSTVNAPTDMTEENGYLKWSNIQKAKGYQIFKITNGEEVISRASNKMAIKNVRSIQALDDTRLIQHQKEEGSNYLISAIDEYGLPTAPVGLDYKSFMDPIVMAPNVSEQVLYLTVGSEEVSDWIKLEKQDFKPEGTEIIYEFSTSNNRKDFSTYTSDFESLPNAKYLKLKITFKRTGTATPMIHSLRVIYKPESVEDFFYEPIFVEGSSSEEGGMVQEFDYFILPKTTTNTKLENVIPSISGESTISPQIDNMTGVVTIPKNVKEGRVVQIINLGSIKSIEKLTPIVQQPSGSKVTQTYQTSTNSSSWSNPTSFPRYAPSGQYVKITTTIENYTAQPIIIEPPVILTTTDKLPKGEVLDTVDAPPLNPNEEPPVVWEEISRFSVTQDAGAIVNWNTFHSKEDLPKNTRIRYVFHTSNNNSTWQEDGGKIDDAVDSRFLKIDVISEKVKGSTITSPPKLYEISVDYINSAGSTVSKIPYNNTQALQSSFSKTGTNVSEWIVPVTGTYRLEVWGGQGGRGGYYCTNGWGGSCYWGSTGYKGSYVSAHIELQEGDTLYIYQGLNGGTGGNWTNSTGSAGRYGKSGGGGGGGGSEVRLNENSSQSIIFSAKGGNGGNGTGSSSGSYSGSGGTGGASVSGSAGYSGVRSTGGTGGGRNFISSDIIEGTSITNTSANSTGGVKISRVLNP